MANQRSFMASGIAKPKPLMAIFRANFSNAIFTGKNLPCRKGRWGIQWNSNGAGFNAFNFWCLSSSNICWHGVPLYTVKKAPNDLFRLPVKNQNRPLDPPAIRSAGIACDTLVDPWVGVLAPVIVVGAVQFLSPPRAAPGNVLPHPGEFGRQFAQWPTPLQARLLG